MTATTHRENLEQGKDDAMAGIRGLYRRWQIAHFELQRHHDDQARVRAEAVLGAYGFTAMGPSDAALGRPRT